MKRWLAVVSLQTEQLGTIVLLWCRIFRWFGNQGLPCSEHSATATATATSATNHSALDGLRSVL